MALKTSLKSMRVPKKSRKERPILWIVDPWATLDHANDTTLRIARELETLGRTCMLAERSGISLDTRLPGAVSVSAAAFKDAYYQPQHEPLQNTQRLTLDQFSQIHYRPDPPIDAAYLKPLQLLVYGCARLGKRAPKILNNPVRLFGANEKLECFAIPELTLDSCVSADWNTLSDFLKQHPTVVVKPLDGAQSKGVFKLEILNSTESSEPLRNAQERLALATLNFTVPVLVQKFLPEIDSGETRLWFAGYKLIGSARKLPLKGDFRVNIDGGSAVQNARLSSAEKSAAKKIARYLKQTGIELAAVDLIAGKITDFNFTSPGLITRMEEALGKNLARPIAKRLIKLS